MRIWAGARLNGLLMVGAVLAACASGAEDVGVLDGAPDGGAVIARTPGLTPTATTTPQAEDERTVGIYASVLRQAFTHDHTFGRGKAPFRRIYVVDALLDGLGFPRYDFGEERLSPAVKRGIADALADLPPVEFVATEEDAQTAPMPRGRVKNRGAIYSMGAIMGAGDRVEVESHMRCGGACALRLIYIVVRAEGEWRVVGDTGRRIIA